MKGNHQKKKPLLLFDAAAMELTKESAEKQRNNLQDFCAKSSADLIKFHEEDDGEDDEEDEDEDGIESIDDDYDESLSNSDASSSSPLLMGWPLASRRNRGNHGSCRVAIQSSTANNLKSIKTELNSVSRSFRLLPDSQLYGASFRSIRHHDDHFSARSFRRSVDDQLFNARSFRHSVDAENAMNRPSFSDNHHKIHKIDDDNLLKNRGVPKAKSHLSEIELMKERFAKLLLGEDMSGGSRGVSSALAISNAITNLSASVFGELWRLEPLSTERKLMWRREIEWLVHVADYIVELVPSTSSPGSNKQLEVMVTRPRQDVHINLPALRKLDTMLLESLETFNTPSEFWYVDQDVVISDPGDHIKMSRQEEKWWLPCPRVPSDGISCKALKHLKQQRECINQILKATLAINNQTLNEMEVPEIYWENLPKSGRASLGDQWYKQVASKDFDAEVVLRKWIRDNLNEDVKKSPSNSNRSEKSANQQDSDDEELLSIEEVHTIMEAVNQLEEALHVWRRKAQKRVIMLMIMEAQKRHRHWHGDVSDIITIDNCNHYNRNSNELERELMKYKRRKRKPRFDARASWDLVRDLVLLPTNNHRRHVVLASRTSALLHCFKQRFPFLPQSFLDRLKIQYNKDVGQSILESYSRVLESLASTIISRIDDILYIDQMTRESRIK